MSIEEVNELDDLLDRSKLNNAEASSGDEKDDKVVLGGGDVEILSRGEKKARKALSKVGLVKIEGINRVTIRRPKGVLYVIAHPEVFKSPDSNCYIVFGEAKVEDQSGLMQAPYNFQPSAQQAQMSKSAEKKKATAGKAAANDDEPADETGLEAKDIAIIMAQTNCSRSAAVRALRDADGDMINAIMAAS